MDDRIAFATWLGVQLDRADVTPAELAEATGVTAAAVYLWLRGKPLAGTSVVRVLHALGIAEGSHQADRAWRAYHQTMRSRA